MNFMNQKPCQFYNYSEKSYYKKKPVMKILRVPTNPSSEFLAIFEDCTILQYSFNTKKVDNSFLEKLKFFDTKIDYKFISEQQNQFTSENLKMNANYCNDAPELNFISLKSLNNLKNDKNPLKFIKLNCSCISDSGFYLFFSFIYI